MKVLVQPSMGQERITCCCLVHAFFLFGFLAPDFLDFWLAVVLVVSSDGGRFSEGRVSLGVKLV